MSLEPSLYPYQKNTLSINNAAQELKLNYIDEGQGNPVVMVHGNPTWSFYYRKMVNKLKDQNRCIVPDHIGCGLSDKPQDYSYRLENHINNLEKLIEHLGLEKIDLIVHDWGGAIGFGYATRHPEKVNKIVILNTAAFTSKNIPFRINLCRIPWLGEKFIRSFNGFAWPATFMAVTKKMDPKVKKGYLYPYNNYKNRLATARFVQDIPLNQAHPSYQTLKDIEDKLHLLKGKKLIVWGKKDFCFNDSFLERWEKIYPEAQKIILDEAGHYVIEDCKEETLNLIKGFLK
ncbi:MAG: alpha/beta fold hydrolase [Bacteriovoracaceae bacterium]